VHTALPAPLLSRLSEVIATHTGLHFPHERWGDLERGIATAASAFGMTDTEAWAQRLVSLPLTQRDIDILAGCLTVGETYFFREKRSFEILEQRILPALLRAREDSGRRLRIWSAGCCTGEEPYSIAMLLDRLVPKAVTWNILLLATDINPVFLHNAAAGEYGEWSFRSTPGWLRDRYFRPGKTGHFRLDPNIRKRVTFSCLNLAGDAYPSLTNNTNAMDIIFCRNVLMYFSAERARAVVDNFHRALVDGGWLIVSPAETSNDLFSDFTAVNFVDAILYRKNAGAESLAYDVPIREADLIQPAWYSDTNPIPAEMSFTYPSPASKPVEETCVNTQNPPQLPNPASAARDCANQGRLSEAAEWCRKAIAADKLDPGQHYLLAMIQQEQGQEEDAAQSLMRALYLAPDFVLAHYALGVLRQSQGQHTESQRHFNNALASLHAHPPDEILPEADGMSAGRLMEIIAAAQSSMQQFATNQ
jgi:chemotaxis protein methyltransferase CheR